MTSVPSPGFLIDYLPLAGMIFRSKVTVLRRDVRDAFLLRAFKSQGIVVRDNNTPDEWRHSKANLEAALVAMFTYPATNARLLSLLATGENLDFESELKKKTPWASTATDESIFAEFFWALVKARQEWHRTPRYPFHLDQHSALARHIDFFLTAAGESSLAKAQVNQALYDLAGGFDGEGGEEVEENGEEGEKETIMEDADVMMDDDPIDTIQAKNITDHNTTTPSVGTVSSFCSSGTETFHLNSLTQENQVTSRFSEMNLENE
jgi:hypothetical protein